MGEVKRWTFQELEEALLRTNIEARYVDASDHEREVAELKQTAAKQREARNFIDDMYEGVDERMDEMRETIAQKGRVIAELKEQRNSSVESYWTGHVNRPDMTKSIIERQDAELAALEGDK